MRGPIVIAVALFMVSPGYVATSQAGLTPERARAFVAAWTADTAGVASFIDADELALSRRLGIEYDGVNRKYLISYEAPRWVGDAQSKLEIGVDRVDDHYSIVTCRLPDSGLEYGLFFRDSNWISPVTYYARDWPRLESKYFRFLVSDTSEFNRYSMDRLDDFVEHVAQDLNFGADELETLRTEKLYYVLCKDEDELATMTGHEARGMYNLALDAVVTTYNAHYHELVHELVNFKLRSLPLYTHPFLQEGIAVALGGRGGKEPMPILTLGRFLQESGMLDYQNLLSADGFRQVDPSMSYPLSGLYNLFLLERIGAQPYLDLYLNHSGSDDEVSQMTVAANVLPPDSAWQEFARNFTSRFLVGFDPPPGDAPVILDDSTATVWETDDRYYFAVEDTLLLGHDAADRNRRSKRFTELFGERSYAGQRYAVVADAAELSVYDLRTNNLVANYVAGFSLPSEPVPYAVGRYRFWVLKRVIDLDGTD